MPSHLQAHFCDFGGTKGPCHGSCEVACDEAGQFTDRWFFNTQSKERSKDDPRLDVQGLKAGGIELESFTFRASSVSMKVLNKDIERLTLNWR